MLKTLGASSIVLAMSAASVVQAAPISYLATLMPENGSGVSGTAQFTLDGNLLTMQLTASGLTPTRSIWTICTVCSSPRPPTRTRHPRVLTPITTAISKAPKRRPSRARRSLRHR